MKYCPHCNKKIPAKANYCPHPDCSKPVRQPLLSWLFGRRDAVIVGVVVGLLLGLLGANVFGGSGASGERVVVRETVVVEREVAVEVTRIVAVEGTPERVEVPVEVPVEVTELVEVEVTRVVEPTAPPEPPSPPPAPTAPPEPAAPSPTPLPALGDTLVRSKDEMTMVFVPAGSFQMGSEDGDSDEKPIHEVALDAFWIDQTEVSNAQFAAFLNERGNEEEGGTTWLEADSGNVLIEQQNDGSFQPKAGFAEHPVIEVSWYGAEAYCAWAEGRLPTEAEWEYAARGTEALIYPWGNEFDGSLANFCDTNCTYDWKDASYDDGYDRTAPVGTFSEGKSWVGAYDMAGNVWEWVNDWYEADYYTSSPRDSPLGALVEEAGDSPRKVLRGGSWNVVARFLRGAYRYDVAPAARYIRIGVRCRFWPGP